MEGKAGRTGDWKGLLQKHLTVFLARTAEIAFSSEESEDKAEDIHTLLNRLGGNENQTLVPEHLMIQVCLPLKALEEDCPWTRARTLAWTRTMPG